VPLIGIPVKPLADAKTRLAGDMETSTRRLLVRRCAERIVTAALATGSRVAVVSDDPEIARLARDGGAMAIAEPRPGRGLDRAAAAVMAAAGDEPWLVCHADLPLLGVSELSDCLEVVLRGRTVLAPSWDGGTNLVGGTGPFRFSYGPGSFHRHLAAATDPEVVVRTGLTWDLDRAGDLPAMARLPAGWWLRDLSGQRVATG
jgi:2-phospho-L-lactate/phosphoenolpyruvate guanylyltransferase